jgi:uncharacterized protein Yka (UPF0111/DUF47 family)
VRFRLIPTDDAFFALFNESAANVEDCAKRLCDMLSDPTNAALHEKVAACEHEGDEIPSGFGGPPEPLLRWSHG